MATDRLAIQSILARFRRHHRPWRWSIFRDRDELVSQTTQGARPGRVIRLGTLIVLVGGAIAWGARLDVHHVLSVDGGIAVIATPVAAIAIWSLLWNHLRTTRHLTLATALVVLALIQMEVGAWNVTTRLQVFGPHDYEPIAVTLLDTIRALPPDAKVAYACQPLDEHSFGVPQLVSIDAHTDHRVVPMRFEAEILSSLTGPKRNQASKTCSSNGLRSGPCTRMSRPTIDSGRGRVSEGPRH